MKIRIATRKSALALAQTRLVASWLKALEPSIDVEEVHVVTTGDRVQDVPLSEVGGKGLFVTELERKLQDGDCDLAVHSLKDVPAELAEGLTLAAVPAREDPRDALVTADGRAIEALREGAVVGTSSLRRRCQLLAVRPDLRIEPLRGNVDTRLRKLREGQYDAIVLAVAGMRRLGVAAEHVAIDPTVMVPAAGQGALGLETRDDRGDVHRLVAQLDHEPTRIEVEAERTMLRVLGGSCQLPIGGHATVPPPQDPSKYAISIIGLVASPDGASRVSSRIVEAAIDARDVTYALARARELGTELAERLLADGARAFVDDAAKLVRGPHLPPPRA
ncbi:MAG: hydroxymethylbilane synthase [Deltaproteobacteria bacterium]|nr:hydroxymethylbilane synthase [Deltaproteobacteria bacterium]